MSTWVKAPGGRRAPPIPNGGNLKPHRPFRRAPYPAREDRGDPQEEPQSFEEALDQQLDYSAGCSDYERYQHVQKAPPKGYAPPADRRSALYQRFYAQLREDQDRRPADCVILSMSTQNMDYAQLIGRRLRERELGVAAVALRAESGLTRALQEVRSEGSPFCILVEQANVELSSCTVIIFSESLKIHRNMPKDQALDFVSAEYARVRAEKDKDPAGLAEEAARMADDYLEREKRPRHPVPAATRHLLSLLAEGLHLYPDELGELSDYLRTRRDQLQGPPPEVDDGSYAVRRTIPPSGLGKPPPLLPTPRDRPAPHPGSGEHTAAPLLPTPGSYPKTKPPPLLSIQGRPGPPLGHPPPPRGPPHGPRGPP
ncbi:nuclear receptor coactivator 5, partial [Megalops cyprinoides]|uniref:nuclear receptor coactivator 5 n=1 Tax=Megalops cyprinoides TaxID=118141 RepID=UPI0018645FD3